MKEEQKRLEEVMVALTLCFVGRDGYRLQQEVAKQVKDLEERRKQQN